MLSLPSDGVAYCTVGLPCRIRFYTLLEQASSAGPWPNKEPVASATAISMQAGFGFSRQLWKCRSAWQLGLMCVCMKWLCAFFL